MVELSEKEAQVTVDVLWASIPQVHQNSFNVMQMLVEKTKADKFEELKATSEIKKDLKVIEPAE